MGTNSILDPHNKGYGGGVKSHRAGVGVLSPSAPSVETTAPQLALRLNKIVATSIVLGAIAIYAIVAVLG